MEIFFTNLLILGGFITIFITLRGFFFWYWRMDKVVALLEQLEENTRALGANRTLDLKKGLPRIYGRKARVLILKKLEHREGFTETV